MPLALGYKHDSFADFFVTYIFFLRFSVEIQKIK